MVLDMVYMTLLRIAAGEEPEEMLKDFDENPFGTSIKYGVRLPILGRQIGLAAQALQQGVSGFSGGKGMVAWSAGEVVGRDLYRGIGAIGKQAGRAVGMDTELPHGQDYLNLIKHVPYIGEAWGRIAFYQMADHVSAPSIEKHANEWFQGLRRPRGGRGGGGSNSGVPTPIAGFTWEAMLSQMGQELFPGLQHQVIDRSQRMMAQPQVQPQVQPQAAPQAQPQPSLPSIDPIGRLVKLPSKLTSPEAL